MTGVYFEVAIHTGNNRSLKDILIAELAEVGFESFVDSPEGFSGYAPEELFNEESVYQILKSNNASKPPIIKRIEPQNWNAAWESQFEPIVVNNEICIRAPFHNEMPQFRFELIIEPRMSFGTGHHATTRLMCQAMQKIDFHNKSVCDMGCGTGILAILAMKMGAKNAFGVDIESWAAENAADNASKNNVEVEITEGGIEKISDRHFDIILANINRNILLDQLPAYSKHIAFGGSLFLSGFLEPDVEILLHAAQNNSFLPKEVTGEDTWRCIHLIKN